jgi:proline iminopeptidase
MSEATVNGTTLWYDGAGGEAAGASTIVTLHGGLGFDHLYMKRSFERLARPDRRVVFFDQRGNGRSGGDGTSITFEQLADDVAGLIDHLGADRATVLGHSGGGFVAQEFALRHPDKLDRLVLIATTPGQLGDGEAPDEQGQGPAMSDELVTLFSALPATDDEYRTGLSTLLPFYFHRQDEATLAAATAMIEGTMHRVAPMVRGFQVLGSWSSVDRLSTISAPSLMLVGRHDVFSAWPQAKRIASRVPNAELIIFEDSGHFPWIEEPDAFFTVLENWLG